ncbi:hypothetical protein [Sphingomonas albertensis]|uniref:GAF domain-containing protein n=1 Tax=Sphingomonas albertensis TaxID=2762591 RepID=A0ABR7AJG9_9SPHN|nr:hypothetical protein [Sphingomonas albertensis]MBC3940603.1 hypothetical protein [Sphingomonas albertensis]
MVLEDREQASLAHLKERIQKISGHLDMGNGTSVANALSTALDLDLRIGAPEDGETVLNALPDAEIDDLAGKLVRVYGTKNMEFTLPLGTMVASSAIGDVRFGHERWLLDAGRPGLHAMANIRRDAHGPNFDLLRSHITRLTRNLPCGRLGLPLPAFIVGVSERHLLHFSPCDEAGGVVLERWANCTDAPRFTAASPTQILEFAESIVADMKTFWERREAIAARARKVRALADAAAAEHGAEVLLLAVDLSDQRDSERVDMYVHYLAIDEAMRVGSVLDLLPDRDDITAASYEPPSGVSHRPFERAKLHRLGADGRIDDMAAAVAAAAPGGAKAVFAKLAIAYESTFEVSTGNTPMFVALFWRDGTIKADISMAGKVEWYRERLEILGHLLPETVRESLRGRTVDSIAALPFYCACKIERAGDLVGGIRLDLEIGTRLVDLSTGRIWDGPASGH